MNTTPFQSNDYLDILFQGRNKNYGGYELRRNYPKRMKRPLLVLLIIALAVAAYGMANNKVPLTVLPTKPLEIVCSGVILPPVEIMKPLPPKPAATTPPPANTIRFTPPVITHDNEVTETDRPPEMEKLKDAFTGEKTEKGDNLVASGTTKLGTGTGKGTAETTVESEAEIPASYVTEMPEFNGNLNQYLSENMVYPNAAREANKEGRVVIKFVVSEDGTVTDAIVEKGVSSALDAEALRVVQAMPKWKPGRQNGRLVKVYYRIPVKFTLE